MKRRRAGDKIESERVRVKRKREREGTVRENG